ncbi:fatty acid desaturase family protein [Paenibacillus qinlingensis]|uniref:fatty acid desaturase family protein n=1 Tax=Paenibacillus qinlingensis TaxID=1837343 RepID=UPI0015659325|nr:fatty acid desaturase family protein [Paenibacillus qinlingensis]NQX58435.1 fatty acid desaturase family protein [Paenibacillus qinlingensis]
MAIVVQKRDYSITGQESIRAQERGLASAEWYASPIPRTKMKELMKRKDGPAIRDTIIWFGALLIFGYLAYLSWGTWWAVPAFFVYGVIYASPGDSRWHECGHGTAFKTPWMNDVVYQIASFFVLRSATPWRWSHARHHTDTIIVGRDPEILMERPPIWKIILMQIFHLYGGPIEIKRFVLHTIGRLEIQEKDYIPASEFPKVFREARIYMLIIVATTAACLYMGSLLPAMFIVLPSFYGNLFVLLFGMTQHLGLYEDVLDHRLNTRTIHMNPIFRFLYWNMNYHTEHHMYPMVPYHALPRLHQEMKGDCPAPRTSLWAALKEVITALRLQKNNPSYVVVKPLPVTAQPYYYGGNREEEQSTIRRQHI